MLRQSKLAEALGYDVLWAHEHQTGAAMYPSPLMTLCGAGRPDRADRHQHKYALPPAAHIVPDGSSEQSALEFFIKSASSGFTMPACHV